MLIAALCFPPAQAQNTAVAAQGSTVNAPAATQALEPSALAARWRPALVSIKIYPAPQGTASPRLAQAPTATDALPDLQSGLERMLGPLRGPLRAVDPKRPETINSGVVFSADGWVLSVGLDAPGQDAPITVTTDDGKTWPARFMGYDRSLSLLLLKIEGAAGLPFMPLAQMASKTTPPIGERVAALGVVTVQQRSSAAITEGLLSASFLGQPWQFQGLISTVPIITSMGGGPLLSLRTGEVLGFCGQHYVQPRSQVSSTVATPIGVVLDVIQRLQARGSTAQGWVGADLGEVPPQPASGNPANAGRAVLSKLTPGGPAEVAGLKVGDHVTEIDGQAVQDSEHFVWLVRWAMPGSTLRLRVARGGEVLSVNLTIAARQRP